MGKLTVSSSPHIVGGDNTRGIMLDVIIALLPAVAGGVIIFGWYSLLVVATCAGAAVISEFLYCLAAKKDQTVGDLSAVVTGILLGLNLPPAIPLWVCALGSAIAIIIVKQFFGGLGQNFVNPAIAARIVLVLSFPTLMTKWIEPLAWMNGAQTVMTSATPLADSAPHHSYLDLFLGLRGGCIGEGCIFLLLCGGLYLVVRKAISPIIPLSFMGTVAVFAIIFGKDPLVWLMSGGVVIGAVFMATDYVTSPITNLGKLIFGIGCGLFTAIIRQYGFLPEGASFAILLMNIIVPHIDNLTVKKPFGWEAVKK